MQLRTETIYTAGKDRQENQIEMTEENTLQRLRLEPGISGILNTTATTTLTGSIQKITRIVSGK
jgi:hypothetical protein